MKGMKVMAEAKRVKKIHNDDLIEVKNGFNGRLIFKNTRNGEVYEWSEFGEVQEIPFSDLKYAKATNKDFYIKNWFLIDDEDVIKTLGVSKYYANALKEEEFDKLFDLSPAEIVSRINKLSNGQKRSLTYKVCSMYKNGKLDSIKVINALEKSLGVVIRDM